MLDAGRSTLILIDLQARLMPAIDRGDEVARRCGILGRAARLLGVPVLATEQNPKGLGGTVAQIAPLAERIVAKLAFDASGEPDLLSAIDPARGELLLAGCEAHVCVLQTALGLQARGYAINVAADAVGSRRPENRTAALDRMARHGVGIVTSEMALFEWLGRSDHPRFREVHALIR